MIVSSLFLFFNSIQGSKDRRVEDTLLHPGKKHSPIFLLPEAMRRGLKGQVGGAPSLRKILLVIAVLVLGLELVYVQLPTQDGPSVSSVEADLMRLGASSLQRKRQLAIQQQNVENESEDDNDEDDHELAPHVDKRTASYDEDASWPLYDVNVNERSGKPMDWPGVGWNKGKETGSESLLKKFKFYLYEDGPFDMRKAEKCMRAHKNLPSTGFGELDEHLRLEEREHLPELFLLPALRAHPMRTDNKDHADLFIIGFSHSLAGMAMP